MNKACSISGLRVAVFFTLLATVSGNRSMVTRDMNVTPRADYSQGNIKNRTKAQELLLNLKT